MTAEDTAPPAFDLAAIEARWQEADRLDSPTRIIRSWRDVPALIARVIELESLAAAARRDGAEEMLGACLEAIEETMPINNHAAGPVRVAMEAVRALAPTGDR